MLSPGSQRTGVRAYWGLLQGLAGGVVFIGIIVTVFVSYHAASRRQHPLHDRSLLVAILLAVMGVVCLLLARQMERPLDGSSDQALVASYRTRFFLWVGFGEAPVFASVIGVVLTGSAWLYLIGAVPAFVAYARIAPTEAHLERDQQALYRGGSTVSLVAALTTPQGGTYGYGRRRR